MPESDSSLSLKIYDPRVWDSLDTKMTYLLVERGPIREANINFPKDNRNRLGGSPHIIMIKN